MKAIYINLDPYLQAFADWLAAGKPGTAPHFDPLPLAVTIPLGESAAIYLNGIVEGNDAPSIDYNTIDGQFLGIFEYVGDGDNIVENVTPAFSALAPGAHYYVRAIAGDSVAVTVYLSDEEGNEFPFVQTVIVRRETASGPVDLVDFTPPVSLSGVSFAGVDIKGAEFDGNEIVAAAGTGALSAPAGA